MPSFALTVNGSEVAVDADPDTPLLDVLRNHLGLVGTRFGCGEEQCGCCMVLIDGKAEKSCGKAVSMVTGKAVVTIEGLGAVALDDNICRCGSHVRILRAVEKAAAKLREGEPR